MKALRFAAGIAIASMFAVLPAAAQTVTVPVPAPHAAHAGHVVAPVVRKKVVVKRAKTKVVIKAPKRTKLVVKKVKTRTAAH